MPGIVRQGDFHAGHAQPAPPYYHTGSFISRNPNVLVNSRPIIVAGDPSTCGATANSGWVVNVTAGDFPVHHMFAPVSAHEVPVQGLHPTVTPAGSLNVLVGSTLTGVVGALFKLPFPAGIDGGITSPVLGDTASKAAGLPSASDILDANKAEIQAGGSAAMNDMLEYGEGALTVLGLVAADSLLGMSPLFDKENENDPEIQLKAEPSASGSGAKFNVVIYNIGQKQYFQVKREGESLPDGEYWNWEPTAGPETTEAFPIREGAGYRRDDILIVDADQFLWPLEGQHHILVVKVLEVENGQKLNNAKMTYNASSRAYELPVDAAGNKTWAEGDIVSLAGTLKWTQQWGSNTSENKDKPTKNVYFKYKSGRFQLDFAETAPPVDGQTRMVPGKDAEGNDDPNLPKVTETLSVTGVGVENPAENSETGRIYKVTWRGNPFAPNKFRRATKTVTKKDADGNDITETIVADPVTASPNAVLMAGAIYRIQSIDEDANTPVEAWRALGFDDRYAEAVPDLYFEVPADSVGTDLAFKASVFGHGTVVQEVESAAVVQRHDETGSTEWGSAGFHHIPNDQLDLEGKEDGTAYWFRPVFRYEVEPEASSSIALPAGLAPAPRISGIVHAPGVDARYTTEFADLLRRIASNYGRPMTVISAFRHEAFNKAAAGAPDSFHTKGLAADIALATKTRARNQADYEAFVRACIDAGVGGIGIQVAKGFVHVDAGPKRAWGIDGSRRSVPDWAARPLKDAGYI